MAKRLEAARAERTCAETQGLRAQYRLERALAQRLLSAPAEQRPALYAAVYQELYRELRRLGLSDGVAQNNPEQTGLLTTLLAPFLGGTTTFVEFGAGSGELACAVAEKVPQVFAVDAVEPTGLSETEVVPLGIDQTGDALATGSVDLAFSCHLVEHLHPEDLGPHLREVRRLLAPGGSYILVTPNRLLGPHDISRHYTVRATGLHLREYAHRDLARALRREGFVTIRALVGIGRPPQRMSMMAVGSLELILGVLPRRMRHAILDLTGRAPLRWLEQVALIGSKPAINRTTGER